MTSATFRLPGPLAVTVAFKSDGDLVGQPGYLFKIGSNGKYQEIPTK